MSEYKDLDTQLLQQMQQQKQMKVPTPCRKDTKEDPLRGCCCCNCKYRAVGISPVHLEMNGKYYCTVFLDYPGFPQGICEKGEHGICELHGSIENGETH